MNYLTNRATEITRSWIKHNDLFDYLGQATSVEELKKLVAKRLFNGRHPSKRFIVGAKLTRWDVVFKFIQDAKSI